MKNKFRFRPTNRSGTSRSVQGWRRINRTFGEIARRDVMEQSAQDTRRTHQLNRSEGSETSATKMLTLLPALHLSTSLPFRTEQCLITRWFNSIFSTLTFSFLISEFEFCSIAVYRVSIDLGWSSHCQSDTRHSFFETHCLYGGIVCSQKMIIGNEDKQFLIYFRSKTSANLCELIEIW